MILALRTDKPVAELYLVSSDGIVAEHAWTAHRQLAEGLLKTIQEFLSSQNIGWNEISGIVCYEGPGSYTGLRIGLSTANALAYSLCVPIVAIGGESWMIDGEATLQVEGGRIALPLYGGPAFTTPPKR